MMASIGFFIVVVVCVFATSAVAVTPPPQNTCPKYVCGLVVNTCFTTHPIDMYSIQYLSTSPSGGSQSSIIHHDAAPSLVITNVSSTYNAINVFNISSWDGGPNAHNTIVSPPPAQGVPFPLMAWGEPPSGDNETSSFKCASLVTPSSDSSTWLLANHCHRNLIVQVFCGCNQFDVRPTCLPTWSPHGYRRRNVPPSNNILPWTSVCAGNYKNGGGFGAVMYTNNETLTCNGTVPLS
eukprot:TRINITY_DN13456_c0_g1_i1.p1 TRINITY_DN13456_c0_g1~~TRINITY_DN13456_c0_g1_i1.p1  ORF type:complete len:237 (-),score=45.28 TRINITY_DN13456_c0_g1_i1:204-914(-)